ncbi:MAG TPA: thioredoxin domain-containing protein [Acidimicrobiia bacterium]
MANRLAHATSPYLLQHKDNPVDWWEWGPEAFAEARARDVPVLLSVGYASCHWCHVMAHESFEDPATADLMNRNFVNIKVDREERPDVDAIYMEAVQAMTGRGGWPMTVFLDHDARPFFAGTYFPPAPRHGMPSFTQLLQALTEAWEQNRAEVHEQASRVLEAVSATIPTGELPGEEDLEAAYTGIAALFDPINGGFGGAPKFPQQPVLEFLLRIMGRPWAESADRMVFQTLLEMASGGIHDQIGGGFSRYSVDERWLVPHFEKMLYDNAQLARLYLWAGIELDRPDFVEVARSTLDYLRRDLMHPDGGFFSAEDADSEGIEGKFYVWTPEEIREVLGERADAVIAYYGVSELGNFEGANVLSRIGPPPEDIADLNRHLLEARARRVRPQRDDKVVTSWHGMAIRAFAEAGRALDDHAYLEIAVRAGDFAVRELYGDDALVRSWRDGRASGPGFLDDHASLALGFFALYAATGDTNWYEQAMALVGELDRFSRPEGGFHTTPDDGPDLVKRPFDITDNPHPSGNAMAAEALLLASLYTGDATLRERAASAVAAARLVADRHPSMVAHHLSVADAMSRSLELAIVGPNWEDLASVHYRRFRPHVALATATEPTDDVPLLAERTPGPDGSARAFVCRNFVCELPVGEPEKLEAQL